jgi:hypothetical protein
VREGTQRFTPCHDLKTTLDNLVRAKEDSEGLDGRGFHLHFQVAGSRVSRDAGCVGDMALLLVLVTAHTARAGLAASELGCSLLSRRLLVDRRRATVGHTKPSTSTSVSEDPKLLDPAGPLPSCSRIKVAPRCPLRVSYN